MAGWFSGRAGALMRCSIDRTSSRCEVSFGHQFGQVDEFVRWYGKVEDLPDLPASLFHYG
jgi:hypothetical protein